MLFPAKESVPHLDHSDLVNGAADPVSNTGFRRPQRERRAPTYYSSYVM